jgi:hypothetical protein
MNIRIRDTRDPDVIAVDSGSHINARIHLRAGEREPGRQVQCVLIRLLSRATARSDGNEIVVGYGTDVAGAQREERRRPA